MSAENWGFDDIEWEEPDNWEDEADQNISLLLIDLGEKAIKNTLDCYLLWEELQGIAEDFPGYMPVFLVSYRGAA